jgi:L-aspartate oxidase
VSDLRPIILDSIGAPAPKSNCALPPATSVTLDAPEACHYHAAFMARFTFDFLVIGSGVSGLTFALEAARMGTVAVLSKRGIQDSATTGAQGGIASVLDHADSFDAHVRDTIEAGAGLCVKSIVETVVRDAPARVRELERIGVKFSQDAAGAELDLGKEGGHSARRIVHAGDLTGQEISNALVAAARQDGNISCFSDHVAIDLVMGDRLGGPRSCFGAWVLDTRSGEIHTFQSPVTVLATGGAGKVYLYTSNPDVATGDGIAMAYRAGAAIANMEFFQFHPTCLYDPRAKNFLISEALRGEGGVLRRLDGVAFMESYSPRKDLAPRDVVTRAIDAELKRTGDEHVLLDMTSRDPAFLRSRFPNIHERCLKFGIDLTLEPIPVVPAAHYCCGGIMTDGHGRTDIQGLFAIGECAHTGLHGANRLASNSLLEGLVFARRAVTVAGLLQGEIVPPAPDWMEGNARPSKESVVVTQDWDEIRRLMWNYVGIVRTDNLLRRARRRLSLLLEEIQEYYWKYTINQDLLELRNIATLADLIVSSAMFRKESRGLHYTLDYPESDVHWVGDTVLRRGSDPELRALPT